MAENKIPQNKLNSAAKIQQDDAVVFEKFARALDVFERRTDENLRKMEALAAKFPEVLQERQTNNEELSAEPAAQQHSFKM